MTPTPQPTTGIRNASTLRCSVYAVIALVAFAATWSQNIAYLHHPEGFAAFLTDTRTTAASRSVTADILLFALAAAVLMVIEARKHGIKYVWLYIVGSGLTAISITFPLFLIARELRIGKTDAPRLPLADSIGLAVFAIATLALTIWVDAG